MSKTSLKFSKKFRQLSNIRNRTQERKENITENKQFCIYIFFYIITFTFMLTTPIIVRKFSRIDLRLGSCLATVLYQYRSQLMCLDSVQQIDIPRLYSLRRSLSQYHQSFSFFFFFLSGFSFTNIHESLDCKGRGRAFL